MDDARIVASAVLRLWMADPDQNQEFAEDMLVNLSRLFPGSLAGLHGTLIDEGILLPEELYRDADAVARDRLIQLLEAPPHEEDAMFPLAWIGDEAVQQAFHCWRGSPSPWHHLVADAVDKYGLTRNAGWDLIPAGTRRDLYHQDCYQLIRMERAAPEGVPGPAGVITPHEEHCGWCGRQLVTLFDIDLQDPRLEFLAPRQSGTELLSPVWRRLRIAMCARCTGFGTVLTDVDGVGGSNWSRFNVRPHYIGQEDQAFPFPERRLLLGPHRRSPYEAMVLEWGGRSQIGGSPAWIQSARYPECPKCNCPMVFAGQLDTGDLDVGEGLIYAFWCAGCGMAATDYQQT